MMDFGETVLYRRLSRRWHERWMEQIERTWDEQQSPAARRAASGMNWLEGHAQPIRAAIVRALKAAPQDSDRQRIPEADWPRVEAHLREVLDLAPVGDKARQVFRPMWPMTLDQLRAMAVEAEPRQNPAPLIDKKKFPRERSHVYGSGRVMYLGPDHSSLPHPEHPSDYEGIDGIAWGLSAPEGFPPIPRRGGVYGREEATVINDWLTSRWPAWREAFAIALEKDQERAAAGIEAEAPQRVIGYGSLTEWLRHAVGGVPSAESKSPKELLAATLAWAHTRFLPAVDAVRDFDLNLLVRWSDPDTHMRALTQNAVTLYREQDVARNIYRLSNYAQDWTKALDVRGERVKPESLLRVRGEKDQPHHRYYPLSVLLKAQAQADRTYRERQAKEKADGDQARAAAIPKLRAMLAAGKAFSRTNVQKALPGYTLYVHEGTNSVSVHLRSPSGANIVYGDGRNITDAMTRLQDSLGLLP